MNHTGLTFATVLTGAALVLAGCDSTTGGNPKAGVDTTPSTSSTTSTTRSAPTTTSPVAPPRSTPSAAAPGAQALAPQDGYVFIATKSGNTRCQLNTQQVDCESNFTNAPKVNGESANGVRVTASGELRWVSGNLGAIPTVTIDYQTYSALGWTIAATPDNTRFTNQASGHGMYISTSEVKAF